MNTIRLAIIGVGNRGKHMADLAVHREWPVEIAALVDTRVSALRSGGKLFGIGKNRQFTDYRELLKHPGDYDAGIIATDVYTHKEIACDFIEAGIPIFLEKPITRTIDEAASVFKAVQASKASGIPVMVGFNLRYAPFYRHLKKLVSSGAVGELISIEWKEILSPAAWADGYCRASWYSKQDYVGGWLLEKSCHDIDQINWLAGSPCARVASFGSRNHFLPRKDLPMRCTDGCPEEPGCYFSCFKLHPDGPVREGPNKLPDYIPDNRWDLCVYNCGSDLMDRQAAILEYENGVTAAFSILPLGNHWERKMRICGTKANICGSDFLGEIHIIPHNSDTPVIADPPKAEGGHGGADPSVMDAFLHLLSDPYFSPDVTIEDGLESMLAAGGIELAREKRSVVELGPLRKKAYGK
ncbi:MAG: Gfo/Idh/MocA family oxidoreductase [Spirochaetales bacterium]|nr:Gfo/Idh/MocA family oxidoreductase [Spirochaetales bacterium]